MSNGVLDDKLKIRIGRASALFGQLCKVLKSNVSFKTKLRIYNAAVIPTLLYGSETWATTQTEEKKLGVFDNRCRRRILGIMWFHHVRNTEVRERTGQTQRLSSSRAEGYDGLGMSAEWVQNGFLNHF